MKRKNECEFCGYSCYNKCSMRRHIVAVHEGKKPYQCDICDATFTIKKQVHARKKS
jgi:hypothetical protein